MPQFNKFLDKLSGLIGQNGHKPNRDKLGLVFEKVSSPKVKPIYKEWIPEELPPQYANWTPTWLYYRLHYEVAAQKVFGLKANNKYEAAKLGLTIAVIIILVVFGVVVMSYGGQ